MNDHQASIAASLRIIAWALCFIAGAVGVSAFRLLN